MFYWPPPPPNQSPCRLKSPNTLLPNSLYFVPILYYLLSPLPIRYCPMIPRNLTPISLSALFIFPICPLHMLSSLCSTPFKTDGNQFMSHWYFNTPTPILHMHLIYVPLIQSTPYHNVIQSMSPIPPASHVQCFDDICAPIRILNSLGSTH